MTNLFIYTKATVMASIAMFALLWCVNGFYSTALLCFYTLSFLVVLAAVIAAVSTLTLLFFDWKNRHHA